MKLKAAIKEAHYKSQRQLTPYYVIKMVYGFEAVAKKYITRHPDAKIYYSTITKVKVDVKDKRITFFDWIRKVIKGRRKTLLKHTVELLNGNYERV